jgi:O-antigen/teichoic acid export membrane protein
MRSQKVLYNILSAFLLQIFTIVCGFIIPRLYISRFGANIHGMVASITQFLSYITLAEAGVGGVTRAALYKPLADRDSAKISGIMKATERFFRIIALGFLGYTLLVAAGFSLFNENGLSAGFMFSLAIIISASTFIQYFFGITNAILMNSDQKQYLHSNLRIVTTVLHVAVVYLMIQMGGSLHAVKLFSGFVFMILPVYLYLHVKRNYQIDRRCPPDNEAIKQRWNGLGQHIAYFLHTRTDVAVLTLFTNFIEVSVYAVHYMVSSGIARIVTIFTHGFEAAFGDMIAQNERGALRGNFRLYELISSSVVVIFFTTAGLLINPFIQLYTKGITDANYHRELFAYILLLSEAVYCIRQPYYTVIVAAGHFKQTQNIAFLEAGTNIVLSVLLVARYGLVGVAIGTLAAMTLRTVLSAYYLKGNILYRGIRVFAIRQIITVANAAVIILVVRMIFSSIQFDSYLEFCKFGVMIVGIAFVITALFDFCFYKREGREMLHKISGLLRRRRQG